MPTILLVIPRAVAARLFLQTDVLPTLVAAGARVVALTPGAVMPSLSERVEDGALILEPLNEQGGAPPSGGMALGRSVLKTMRRASLNGRRSSRFAIRYGRIREAYAAAWPRWIGGPVHLFIRQVLWRSRTLRRLVLKLDVALSSYSAHADVFDRYRPDIVVGAGLGYFKPDEIVYQEAAKRGIKLVSLVSGWDNPSTKGYRAVDFDRVVAWSERMRDQIESLHDVPRERIAVAGAPQWDLYFRDSELPTREALCTALDLDPSKRLVFHASFPPSSNPLPYEQIATALAEATSSGELGEDVQLVIRLHPKFMRRDKEAARRPYEALGELPGVRVNFPEVAGAGRMSYDTTEQDARVLGGLLKHCEVLVNVFSTTTLEGFLLDRPVVMVQPDPHLGEYQRHSYQQDPRRWIVFSHLRPLVDSGAARIARSPADLIEHVRAYLRDPSLDRARRREVAWLECGPTDGRAGSRTAGEILQVASLSQPSPAESPPETRAGVGA